MGAGCLPQARHHHPCCYTGQSPEGLPYLPVPSPTINQPPHPKASSLGSSSHIFSVHPHSHVSSPHCPLPVLPLPHPPLSTRGMSPSSGLTISMPCSELLEVAPGQCWVMGSRSLTAFVLQPQPHSVHSSCCE